MILNAIVGTSISARASRASLALSCIVSSSDQSYSWWTFPPAECN
jgi:hypothetical protein